MEDIIILCINVLSLGMDVSLMKYNAHMMIARMRSFDAKSFQTYNLSSEVLEPEIYYFKTPITMEKGNINGSR
ncbi:unnamed protein product [Brugia pahangi]|uniref:Ovule protein n=2 Tax=Brugia TaxID=6278 RepID=A0A0N4SZ67_BRUPA|nr:unnamed protein product [Brugia pahangi]